MTYETALSREGYRRYKPSFQARCFWCQAPQGSAHGEFTSHKVNGKWVKVHKEICKFRLEQEIRRQK
jgi:hypothetical protein